MLNLSDPTEFSGRVGFAVGTGRCGTTFLHRVLQLESQVASSHERDPLLETFHKYCCWNELPVDEQGFLEHKSNSVAKDLRRKRFSFESSGQLALSVPALFSHFRAKFVLLVRNPMSVVASYVRKGYYETPYVQANTAQAIGYQPDLSFHHFLGRLVPRHDEFQSWNSMTQVGKVAWFYKTINATTLTLLQTLPDQHWTVVRLEDFTFDEYMRLTRMLGFESDVTNEQFALLSRQRPNASESSRTLPEWTSQEIEEFEREASNIADTLDYPTTYEACRQLAANQTPADCRAVGSGRTSSS